MSELRQMAKGFEYSRNGDLITIIHVKLLSVSADMVEANRMCGCKGPGAIHSCQFCIIERDYIAHHLLSTNTERLKLTYTTPLSDHIRALAKRLGKSCLENQGKELLRDWEL